MADGITPLGRNALGRETASAAAWAFVALAGGRLVSVGALICLARLLAPADFGLLAFALAFVTYMETIGDLGASAALIYWPDRDRSRQDVAQLTFVISIAAGTVWLGVTLIAAPWVAAFFQDAGMTAILRALAWTFPLKALGTTHDALAQKELRFRARLVPEIGLAAFKAAVAIVLASVGLGVWSLVFGHLAGVLAWTVLLWIIVPWRPRARVPLELLRPVLAYGRDIMAVNVLAAIVHHADILVVGRMLGATALGFYQVAGRLPDATLMMVVRVAGRILFPAFARVGSDPSALRSAYLVALRYIALLVVPAAVALALLAGPLVAVFFGAAWEPAVPILRALAVYTGLRALGTHAGDALKAAGRPGVLAGVGLLKAALIVPALILAARFDAAAVAWALTAFTALSLLASLAIVSRVLALGPAEVWSAIRAALGCASVMALVLASWLRAAAPLHPAIVLAGGVALAMAAGAGLAARVTPEIPAMLLASMGRRAFRRPGPGEAALAGGRQ